MTERFKEKLIEILNMYGDVNAKEVKALEKDTPIKLDSLARVDLTIHAEDEMNISFTDSELKDIQYFGELEALISNKKECLNN